MPWAPVSVALVPWRARRRHLDRTCVARFAALRLPGGSGAALRVLYSYAVPLLLGWRVQRASQATVKRDTAALRGRDHSISGRIVCVALESLHDDPDAVGPPYQPIVSDYPGLARAERGHLSRRLPLGVRIWSGNRAIA